MHQASLDRCQEFINQHLQPEMGKFYVMSVADVGSYDVNGTYKHLFSAPHYCYSGVDIEAGPNVDFVVPADGPWDIDPFDVVISGQCLEHVAKPWKWIKLVASLLKPGGLLWVTAPNTWVFHEHPIDAWRVWPAGLSALFDEAGLEDLGCSFIHTETFGVARKPR